MGGVIAIAPRWVSARLFATPFRVSLPSVGIRLGRQRRCQAQTEVQAIGCSSLAFGALGTLRERLFHGHLDFRGREILDMRGERPLVAEGVGHDAVAVAPEHVLRGHEDRGAGVRGALDRGVAVFNIVMDRDRSAGQRLGRRRLAAAEFGKVVDKKHDAAADPNGRVHDPAPVRREGAVNFRRAEGPLVELNRVRARVAHQVPNRPSWPAGIGWVALLIVKTPWYMGERVVSATSPSCQTRASGQ